MWASAQLSYIGKYEVNARDVASVAVTMEAGCRLSDPGWCKAESFLSLHDAFIIRSLFFFVHFSSSSFSHHHMAKKWIISFGLAVD